MTQIDEIDELNIEFKAVLGECWKFFFMSAGKEFQMNASRKLSLLLVKTSQIKARKVALSNEKDANLLLSVECVIQALISEFQMWICLKEDNPNEAWDHLIDAQESASSAICADEIFANQFNQHFEKLYLLEKVLFRPQVFASLRVTIGEILCSICNKEYEDEECDHLIGKPYMGKFCREVVTKIDGGLAFDVVDNPYNKRFRTGSVKIGNFWRDYMTWRVVPDKEAKKEINQGTVNKKKNLKKKKRCRKKRR